MSGILAKVLEWLRSYLEQRSQGVSVRGILSDIQFLLYHKVQFLVLRFSQYIPILLGSLRNAMGLHITCMLMTYSCIYHWILTMS